MKKYLARVWPSLLVASSLWSALACGNPVSSVPGTPEAAVDPLTRAETVKPPFPLRGDAEDLLLVWYDEAGMAHAATRRADVPEANRQRVRVDSLAVAPDQRLDPAFVYVADLRAPAADGNYQVRKVPRDAFEASLHKAAPADEKAVAASNDVIIYGASWCGACKQAARFFQEQGVPFVEKDIEKQPGARSEMLSKAKAQGVSTSGIPVIDVRGTLLGGFDPVRVQRLLASK